MDTVSGKTPAELNVKLKKKRKRRSGKKKANDGCVVQSMDQKDKNVHDFESGKNGTIAKACSQENLMELDSAAKLSEENPKSGMDSTTNPLEKYTKSRRKRMRKAKKKAASKLGPESMDHTNIISNSSLADAIDAYAGGKINNEADESQESRWSTGKGSAISLPSPSANLAKKDVKLVNKQPASSPSLLKVSTDSICHQFLQERVESGTGICNKKVMQHRSSEIINKAQNHLLLWHTDNTPYGVDPNSDKNLHDFESGKNGMIAKACSQENLMELDSAAKLSEENPKSGMDSTTNPLEKYTKSRRKRMRKAKKKAASKLGPESMDHTNIISNSSLADAIDAYASGKINNEADESQESGWSTGKGSAISLPSPSANLAKKDVKLVNKQTASSPSLLKVSTDSICHQFLQERVESGAGICNKKVMQHRSSEIINKAQNHLLSCHTDNTPYRVDPNSDKNLHYFESGKNGTIAKACSQENLMELDSAAKLSEENPKSGMDSTTNPLKKSTKARKRRMQKAKKKAASKLGTESMDHTNIISNSSLADASDAYAGGKINNEADESQESGWSTGKGSAISLPSPLVNLAKKDVKLVNGQTASSPSLLKVSTDNICHQFLQERVESGAGICNKKVMQHRSSEIINKAQNYLIADPYQIPRRKKLLILDVNGLLADVVKPAPKGCEADTKLLGRAIFRRPFYLDFLKFCFERFDVGIWSSRSRRVLVRVVDYLLGDLKHKLLFCWDVYYCTGTRFKTLENKRKPMVFKELRKLWEKCDPNLPWEKGDYDESNTLLLDDSPYKALLNPMHTGVFPCSYSYKTKSDNSLGPGGDIRVYLEGLAMAENVQHYVVQHPFGQSAINETDPHWNFYSGVLQSFFVQSAKGV